MNKQIESESQKDTSRLNWLESNTPPNGYFKIQRDERTIREILDEMMEIVKEVEG